MVTAYPLGSTETKSREPRQVKGNSILESYPTEMFVLQTRLVRNASSLSDSPNMGVAAMLVQ